MKTIHWRSRITGATGHGEPMTEEAAEAWLEAELLWFDTHEHWLEEDKPAAAARD
jgi:hypothetical protein